MNDKIENEDIIFVDFFKQTEAKLIKTTTTGLEEKEKHKPLFDPSFLPAPEAANVCVDKATFLP